MPGGLFLGGNIVRFVCLGHFNGVLDATARQLPGINSVDLTRVMRIVMRNVGQPMEFREDGVTVAPDAGMFALADEVIVTDNANPGLITTILASSATADGRMSVIYYGH